MIIGHLAIAALIQEVAPDEEGFSLILGSVFPDIGDKTIKYVRGLRQGRGFFHSALGFVITAAGMGLILSRRQWRSWFIGYVAHLLADVGEDLPFWHPFRYYEFSYSGRSYPEKIARTVTHPKWMETVFVFAALFIWAGRLLRFRKSSSA